MKENYSFTKTPKFCLCPQCENNFGQIISKGCCVCKKCKYYSKVRRDICPHMVECNNQQTLKYIEKHASR